MPIDAIAPTEDVTRRRANRLRRIRTDSVRLASIQLLSHGTQRSGPQLPTVGGIRGRSCQNHLVYHERPSTFRDAVVWSARSDRDIRVLPDGCMDLIWDGAAVLVAGPDTTAHLADHPAGTTFIGLRFAPGRAPDVLGLPADQLVDQRVSLDDIWSPSEARSLTQQLAAASDPGTTLETCATDRLRRVGSPSEPTGLIAGIAEHMRADRSVATTAAALGLSERQLHRRSLAAFGYGPKTLARVLRLQRALAVARSGTPLAMTAALCGYADQAHLSREVKGMAGLPLGQLVAIRS